MDVSTHFRHCRVHRCRVRRSRFHKSPGKFTVIPSKLNVSTFTPIHSYCHTNAYVLHQYSLQLKKKHPKGSGAQGRRRHGGRARSTRGRGAIASANEVPLPPITPFQPSPYNGPPISQNPYDIMPPPSVPIVYAVAPVTHAHIPPPPSASSDHAFYPYSIPATPSTTFGAGISEFEPSVAFPGSQHSVAPSESVGSSAVHTVDERLRAVSDMIQVVVVMVLETLLMLHRRLRGRTSIYLRNVKSAGLVQSFHHRNIFECLEIPYMLVLRCRAWPLAVVPLLVPSTPTVLHRLSIASQKP
jgi:hypothetical protein